MADRRRALALAATVLAVAGSAPAAASARPAPPTRTLCVDKVTVRDSPSGYAIGYLFRPQRLTLVSGHAVDHYVLIRSRRGLAGWIPEKALCPPPARR